MKLRDALLTEPSWCILLTNWRDVPSSPARRAVDRATPSLLSITAQRAITPCVTRRWQKILHQTCNF
ncbi:hypothetical protein A2U01_0083554 [Trifolium medium]|uniref:Uncharacterized protein n=1 Tax=Trifolium medium TaxID=97028 RepID=A0A392TPE2_9FABA|nr:hypothetical protein [Trifolium medium]